MARPSVTNSATNSGNNVTNLDITLTVSSGSGRTLWAFADFFDTAQTETVSSVTFDPGGGDQASFTHVTGTESISDVATSRHLSDIWWLSLGDGVSGGSYTVRITYTNSVFRSASSAWEVAAADTTDPIGGVATATGSSDSLSVSVSSEASTSLVAMGGLMREEVNYTAGSGDTEVTDVNFSNCSTWTGHTPGTGGTDTVSATSSDTPNSDSWAASAVEILEAAAGGGRTTKNTDTHPLGVHTGIAWRINQP